MSLLSWLRQWRRERRRQSAATKSVNAPLREFVYLDDVSVYSLTASRLGSIATEFTDVETNTLGGEIGSSIEASTGFAKGSVRAKSSASREMSSQVLRKSIIQTAFRDLVELERDRLVLGRQSAQPPEPTPPESMPWVVDGVRVVDPQSLTRGQLVELEVELEADAVFRVNAVVSAFLEIVQEDLEVFGVTAPVGIAEARAMNRVLDKLLTGLVPLRGRAVDFVVVDAGDRELIVHHEVVKQTRLEDRPRTQPLIVVGVAEHRLFWKDIRRVLFSNSRYRIFCRISEAGLRNRWTPVKLTDVLKEIAPEFESQLLGTLGESTLSAMGEAMARSSTAEVHARDTLERAAVAFAEAVAGKHGNKLGVAPRLRKIAEAAAEAGGSLETIDDRRAFYGGLLVEIDKVLGVTTTPEVAEMCRVIATSEAGLGLGGTLAPSAITAAVQGVPSGERFVDTEIVAIYW